MILSVDPMVGAQLSTGDLDRLFDRRNYLGEAKNISTGRSEERRVGKECRSRWSPRADEQFLREKNNPYAHR